MITFFARSNLHTYTALFPPNPLTNYPSPDQSLVSPSPNLQNNLSLLLHAPRTSRSVQRAPASPLNKSFGFFFQRKCLLSLFLPAQKCSLSMFLWSLGLPCSYRRDYILASQVLCNLLL